MPSENTKLNPGKYAWSAIISGEPLRRGSNTARDCSGVFTARPGDTVRDALYGMKSWFAQREGFETADVTIVRYSLHEVL